MSIPLPPCDHDGCPNSGCGHQDIVDELEHLRNQVELAITLVKGGHLVWANPEKERQLAAKIAKGEFVVGDFVIRRRK